jgi:hypothetical protein
VTATFYIGLQIQYIFRTHLDRVGAFAKESYVIRVVAAATGDGGLIPGTSSACTEVLDRYQVLLHMFVERESDQLSQQCPPIQNRPKPR